MQDSHVQYWVWRFGQSCTNVAGSRSRVLGDMVRMKAKLLVIVVVGMGVVPYRLSCTRLGVD